MPHHTLLPPSLAAVSYGLLALVGTVTAQQTEAVCMPSYSWAFNSLSQSPCVVASYLEGACADTVYDISALDPDSHYVGPDKDQANLCACSSVVYSLASACGDCQGGSVTEKWSFWIANCSSNLVTSNGYGASVPSGTAIPAWAFIDVVDGDIFNSTQAEVIAGENRPDTLPNGSSSGGGKSTSSSGGGSSTNIGAIAGGVVGGVVVIGLIIALIVFIVIHHRRKRQQAVYDAPQPPMTAAMPPPGPFPSYMPVPGANHSPPTTATGSEFHINRPPTFNGNAMPPPQLYNPDDPSTFPLTGHPGTQFSPAPTTTTYTGSPSPVSVAYTNPKNRFSGMPEI